MPQIRVKFKLNKETTGAIRYSEIDPRTDQPYPYPNSPGCIIGTVYLRKAQLGNSTPESVTLTIDWE